MSLLEVAGVHCRGFGGAVAIHALRERELEHLGVLVSERAPARAWAHDHTWLSEALPARPGRILVGHCGAGATLAWLLARGWDVEAFDPSRALVRRARAVAVPSEAARPVGVPAALATERGRASLPRAPSRAARARVDVLDLAGFIDSARGPFDAVLLAGFDRALTPTARASLLRACVTACPRGPIVLTWSTHGVPPERVPPERVPPERVAPERVAPERVASSAVHAGERIGRALAALRGLSSDGRDALAFVHDVGPASRISLEELTAIAARLGYRSSVGVGHATLVRTRRAPERALEDVAVDLLVDVLAQHGRHRMVARGGSMSPAIASGSLVELVRCPAPSPGDVVAARVQDRLLVHRVVGTDAAGCVLLKGDACSSPDGWVTPRDVLGRVASFDDGAGSRAVPPATPGVSRWRRGLSRIERALRALA